MRFGAMVVRERLGQKQKGPAVAIADDDHRSDSPRVHDAATASVGLLALFLELYGVRIRFREWDHLLHVQEYASLQRVWPEPNATDGSLSGPWPVCIRKAIVPVRNRLSVESVLLLDKEDFYDSTIK